MGRGRSTAGEATGFFGSSLAPSVSPQPVPDADPWYEDETIDRLIADPEKTVREAREG